MGEFEATDRYASLLEEQIQAQPELWLWTHNRWKRSYQEWQQRQQPQVAGERKTIKQETRKR